MSSCAVSVYFRAEQITPSGKVSFDRILFVIVTKIGFRTMRPRRQSVDSAVLTENPLVTRLYVREPSLQNPYPTLPKNIVRPRPVVREVSCKIIGERRSTITGRTRKKRRDKTRPGYRLPGTYGTTKSRNPGRTVPARAYGGINVARGRCLK